MLYNLLPLEPGLDHLVLLEKERHVRNEILDHVHVGQGVDLHGGAARGDLTANNTNTCHVLHLRQKLKKFLLKTRQKIINL